MKRKAHIWISALLYILITTIVVVIILEAGKPLLDNMRDQNKIYTSKEQFIVLSNLISELNNPGSQVTSTFELDCDKIIFDNSTGNIECIIETNDEIMAEGSSESYGDVSFSAGSKVNSTIINNSAIISNKNLRLNFSIIGSQTNHTTLDTSELINSVYFIETETFMPGNLSFIVNDNALLTNGTGYTEILDNGSNLPFARYKVNMFSTVNYSLMFTLRGESDYFEVYLE